MIDEFTEISKDPGRYARQWKARSGQKVIGTFCSYAPEEIVVAGGALPYRIFGTEGTLTRADAHLQAYSCSLVRSALEDALAGRLDFLDGVVFPHTCDSIQRLSDIWRLNQDGLWHADVVLPVKLDTQSARDYMVDVLARFRENLQTALGMTISDGDLHRAIQTVNRVRAALETLYEIRRDRPESLPGSDLHAVMRAAMVMDRQTLADRLEALIVQITEKRHVPASEKKRIVLSGGICTMPDLYRIIEAAGGTVVWDDLCTGFRYVAGTVDTQGDPVSAIARRYAQRAVCPAKHAGLRNRADALIRSVQASRADGVIFVLLKFCDPHLFDYPYLKTALDEAGIPSLYFEIQEQMPAEGQMRTRCEAFIEML